MTTVAVEPRVTPDAHLNLPENNTLEVVDGQLAEKPASRESSRIGVNVCRLLGNEAARTGGAEVYGSDLGYGCFTAQEMIRKPDISVIRSERLPVLLGDVGYMPLPADLAVEVLSPNELSRDVSRKVEDYLAAGFKLIWVIEPELQLVQIHRIDGTVTKLHAHDEITGESALPGFRCRVADLLA